MLLLAVTPLSRERHCNSLCKVLHSCLIITLRVKYILEGFNDVFHEWLPMLEEVAVL